MSEKRIIRRRRIGSAGSDSEDEEEVVLSGASEEEGVSRLSAHLQCLTCTTLNYDSSKNTTAV